jgi:predicted ATPase/class 3 adenylate cyclase
MLVFFMETIDGAAEKWERYGALMKEALQTHDQLLRNAIEQAGGTVVKHTGDGFFAVFENGDPLGCAITAHTSVLHESWGEIGEIMIKIGIHYGEAEKRSNDYFGIPVNRTARIMSAAWGGQTLVSNQAKDQCVLPPDAQMRDLGVHVLQDLGEPQQIFELTHPDLDTGTLPPIQSLSNRPHNLPAQTTPFIGRTRELQTIAKLLDNPGCRLVSLVGPGGIGKTRLALQAGAERTGSFLHGVYFVPLDDLTVVSVQFLVFSICDAIRFTLHGKQDPKVQLLHYLHGKHMLIIMDNFEHLVEESTLLTEIFGHTPTVKFLVTSRERLNLPGEFPIEVSGLDCPDAPDDPEFDRYASIQIFLQSAQRVDPGFAMSPADMPAICSICKRVEGIPLGIELAASWVRALSCKEIDQEINKGMDFLTSTLRDVPERHRSLRSVFNYSWDLLAKKEKQLCQRLSIFEGGFTTQAAAAIARASLSDLASLADKSLLRRYMNGRYEVQKILRQYAREKIVSHAEEFEKTKKLHAHYFADVLHDQHTSLASEKQVRLFQDITTDIENIRTALQWAIEHCDIPALMKMSDTMVVFFERKGWYTEGQQLFSKIVHALYKKPDAMASKEMQLSRSKAVFFQGRLLRRLGNYEEAEKCFARSLATLRTMNETRSVSAILLQQSIIAMRKGNLEHAEQLSVQARDLSIENDDDSNHAQALTNLGVIAYYKGDLKLCRQMHEQALAIRKKRGHMRSIAAALNNLANITHALGDRTEARRLFEQSLAIHNQINDQSGLTITYGNIALIYQELGETEKARNYFNLSLDIARQIGDPEGLVNSLLSLGNFHVVQKELQHAARIYHEALEVALRLNAMPRILASLDGIASLLIAREDYETGATVYLFLREQPRLAPEIINSLDHVMKVIHEHISPERLDELAQRVHDIDLNTIISEACRLLPSE